MLARSFKTAAQLNISPRNHQALVATLGVLERQEIQHEVGSYAFGYPQYDAAFSQIDGIENPVAFNMVQWSHKNRCGTVCCIGGLASQLGGHFLMAGPPGERLSENALYDLFYPRWVVAYGRITVQQAAQALANYLTRGHARWAEVLEEPAPAPCPLKL